MKVEFLYAYDKRNQLIARGIRNNDGPVVSEHEYKYDVNGNRIEYKHDFGIQYVAVNSQSDDLSSRWENGTKESGSWYDFTYDLKGQRLSRVQKDKEKVYETETYSWDARDNLLEVKRNDKRIQSNQYEYGTELRYQKTYTHSPTKTERTMTYSYDQNQKLISTEEGGITHSYIYFGNQLIGRVTPGQGTDGKDLVFWYHNNAQGTPVITQHKGVHLISQGGKPVEHTATILDSWGNLEVRFTPISLMDEPLIYTGKFEDLETKSVYFHRRHLMLHEHRFLNHDEAGIDYMNPLSINRFAYVWNNPMRYVDPDGRNPAISFFNFAWFEDYGETPEQSLDSLVLETKEFAEYNLPEVDFVAGAGFKLGMNVKDIVNLGAGVTLEANTNSQFVGKGFLETSIFNKGMSIAGSATKTLGETGLEFGYGVGLTGSIKAASGAISTAPDLSIAIPIFGNGFIGFDIRKPKRFR